MKTLTPQEIRTVVKIGNPLAPPVRETQPFGANYLDLYSRLGLKGHNGIDYAAPSGTSLLAVVNGTVTFAGENPGWGVMVELETNEYVYNFTRFKMRFLYGHLKDVSVQKGEQVQGGELIGHADSTGLSTGDHLHFGAYPYYHVEGNLWVRDATNGYGGAIDPQPLYWNPTWNAKPVDLRYGEKRDLKREFAWRVRHGTWAFYKLRRLPTQTEINGFVYGYWNIEAILDPAMAAVWWACSKPMYDTGRCKSPYHL